MFKKMIDVIDFFSQIWTTIRTAPHPATHQCALFLTASAQKMEQPFPGTFHPKTCRK